ncbi:hypothetical protein BCR39DRAFT_521705 [Naematelia encephala]|uniref:Origin recognition complex subunit 3 winged helix C-terminal domain-containing protein n=1 Tax=Naematelia encephala TaxID=71784 RepID=A0A1Y2BE37_9TREE|nr:hypothetical protein BCR39DRAFT_521705 [Naematelia encephala]
MLLKPTTPQLVEMTADSFESLSQGVFVIPFQEDENVTSGPSQPRRPLARLYEEAWTGFNSIHENFETSRTSEQLDDIADWLDRCSTPPLLKLPSNVARLPLAIVQNISAHLPPLLSTLLTHVYTMHGRETSDLTAAVRSLTVGFIGEAALANRKSGRTGLDEVERWWTSQKDKSPLLIHIEQAQLVPSSVLAELTYILTLHPDLPIRLLLSVPSTTLFLSTWTHIEPSAINLCILQAGKSRGKRGGAVNAILRAGRGPLRLSERTEEALRADEEMFGSGASSALKALKWLLLFHSQNSALAAVDEQDKLAELQAILEEIRKQGPDAQIPGNDLFELDIPPDLGHTQDPAPRISILHALSQPSSFHHSPQISTSPETVPGTSASGRSSTKRTHDESDSHHVSTTDESDSHHVSTTDERGDLKELQTLFALWRGAGKTVNLWDWLEGFRGVVVSDKEEENTSSPNEQESNGKKRRRGQGAGAGSGEQEEGDDDVDMDEEEVNGDKQDEQGDKPPQLSDQESERLHAAFIRFCEEARMLGLVRARAKGGPKRADEVIKSIGLV